MIKGKDGEPIFESLEEAHNYIDHNCTREKVRQNALNRKSEYKYGYDCPTTRRSHLLSLKNRIKDSVHRKVYCFLVDASYNNIDKKDSVEYLAYKIFHVKPETILDWEKKAFYDIKNSLERVVAVV